MTEAGNAKLSREWPHVGHGGAAAGDQIATFAIRPLNSSFCQDLPFAQRETDWHQSSGPPLVALPAVRSSMVTD
jgi:hypothetical protein